MNEKMKEGLQMIAFGVFVPLALVLYAYLFGANDGLGVMFFFLLIPAGFFVIAGAAKIIRSFFLKK